MKVSNFVIKENEYKGNKFYSIYVVIDGQEYMLGTLKGVDTPKAYVNCIHKEFKTN